jgi:hypothetical protein
VPSLRRPHVLGIDDGPFDKFASPPIPTSIVGVMMEGPDLVEAIAITSFPIDGDGVTEFLADWILGLRFRPALHGILLGGITIAGLCIVDVHELARRVGLPVMVVNRRQPTDGALCAALERAGFPDRVALVARAPQPVDVGGGLFAATAGAEPDRAAELLAASRGKSDLPEPLRLAHMIARAVATGESRGRP